MTSCLTISLVCSKSWKFLAGADLQSLALLTLLLGRCTTSLASEVSYSEEATSPPIWLGSRLTPLEARDCLAALAPIFSPTMESTMLRRWLRNSSDRSCWRAVASGAWVPWSRDFALFSGLSTEWSVIWMDEASC